MALVRQATMWKNRKLIISFKIIFALLFSGNYHTLQARQQKLSVPRFVSLRAPEVNVRVGPGSEYPIEWVLKYEKMPVEIIGEFEVWRKIRDFEGSEGWVHQSMLSGTRTVMTIEDNRILKKSHESSAVGIAKVQIGVVGKLLECKEEACRISAEGYKGWLPRTAIWGVYPTEFRK
jgi:SH3-like domain-containing protein